MTESLRSVVLAIIQGLTEFLPISSSAHLILPAQLLGWQDQGLAFDVAVHLGSLLAVVFYFREQLLQLAVGGIAALRARQSNAELRMIALLLLASLPIGVSGLLLKDWVAGELRSVTVIALATIGFGVLLGLADRGTARRSEFGWRAALLIGLAQVLAIIPGTSRSGITMTAALLCGINRQSAARFSFLLSIPVILGASTLTVVELGQAAAPVPWGQLLIGVLVAGTTAYASIAVFLRWLDRVGFMPFVIYRVVLGVALLILVGEGY
ncbi:MAG: undecaprenyl-diphosphate phosphatase [Halieaceae bacterium]